VEVVEIAELYVHIKKHYPFFDATLDKVKEDYKYLRDFPSTAAQENIDRHIMTETATPGIAHIRGRLGDMLDSQRSKDETASYFAQLEASRLSNAPPPTGYWDHIRTLIRGDL
jgi:hypothetical protein